MSPTDTDTYRAAANNTNLSPSGPLEKDYGNGYHLDNSMDADTALRKIQTSGSISISPELFEKIYLSPQNKVAGDLRKTFGNPTPLALVGFLLSLTPLSCDLMGWRGAGPTGDGSASIGAYFFFGGLLMVLGGVGEFILGNTFPFVVFSSFGAFWLTFAATLQPFYSAFGNYAGDIEGSSTTTSSSGLTARPFNAAFGFFLVWMGVLCFLYMIMALRTNLVFFLIFMFLVPAFGLLANAFFMQANDLAGTASAVGTQLQAAGALAFVVCCLGWYIFMAIMLASLDFPFQLPVGDLTRFVKGASDKKRPATESEEGMGV